MQCVPTVVRHAHLCLVSLKDSIMHSSYCEAKVLFICVSEHSQYKKRSQEKMLNLCNFVKLDLKYFVLKRSNLMCLNWD